MKESKQWKWESFGDMKKRVAKENKSKPEKKTDCKTKKK